MNARNRIALATSALKRSEITRGLPEEAIAKLAASAKFQEFDVPTLLARAGGKANYVRYIITGDIRRHIITTTGDFVESVILSTGQWSNWAPVLTSPTTKFDTWSSAKASYLAFPQAVVKTIAMEHPQMLLVILKQVSTIFSTTLDYVLSGSLGGDDRQLAQLLLLKCSTQLDSSNIELATTQIELAKLTGFSRQKISRILKTFQANDLIKVGYGSINVLNKEKLRGYL